MQEQKFYNLTNPQKSIWVTEEYFKGSAINNICGTALIKEKVNLRLLEKSILQVLKNNDIFKIRFCVENGEVKQFVSDYINSDIIYLDAKNIKEFNKLKDEIVAKPFHLLNSHPYNFYIIKFPNGHAAFSLNIHHILADSWTLGFLSKQVVKTYCALLQLDEPYYCETYSYIDYMNSENVYKKSERFLKDKKYWNNEFETIPELPFIPGSNRNSANFDNIVAKRLECNLDKNFVLQIKSYCKKNNITLFNFFMAIYSVYIHGVTGLDDFVIGTPILNRTNFKEKNTAGMFINMAPLRVNFDNVSTFKDFVKHIASKSMGMLKHQKYSYQSLLEDLRETKENVPTLYNIVFSYQITNTQSKEIFVDYSTDWTFNGNSAENMTIQVLDLDNSGDLNICYDYKTSIYTADDIKSTHERILHLIHQVISSKSPELSNLECITPKEKNVILNIFNNTLSPYNPSKTLIDLFEKMVKKDPNRIAIVHNSIEYSYKTLNNMANIIADCIGQTKNLKIAVLCEKSALTVASFLGIMKSGNCYIPIDTEYPKERIDYILKDSGCSLLITYSENEISKNYENKLILKDLDFSKEINYRTKAVPEDLAYIIYTSGTTGKPKGVKIKHKNIINTLIWRKKFYKFDKNTTVYQIPSFSFDSSVEDIFTPLISGSKLIISSTPKIDINKMCDDIKKYHANHFLVVPSLYKILLREKSEYLKSLKHVTIAGENFNINLVKEHFEKLPNVRLVNEYGPTENSVCSTYCELTKNDLEIYIGKPISNCNCFCLDNKLNLLPPGVPGELYVSGPGVSEGYLNKPEMTKKSFIDNPFGGKYKLYKTGDVVEYTLQGKLRFIDRIDNQVKLHGFRIELKEIEQTILKNPNILDVVVTKKQDSNDKSLLVAYIVANSSDFDISDLSKSLREFLPLYMIPSIVKLDKIPLTPNGKVDVNALPLPKAKKVKSIQPISELEKEILEICKDVTKNKDLQVSDDLFEIGGADSLDILTINSKLFAQNLKINTQDFYKYPTVKELAEYLSKSVNKNYNEKEQIIKPNITKLAKNINKKDLRFNYKNVLLTGSTGFLGIHILDYLLKNTNSTIYCIIRKQYGVLPEKRLENFLDYYFGKDYYIQYKKRIVPFAGELSEDYFNLSQKDYINLQKKIDCIINTASNTKHYGSYSTFKKANVDTVKNLILFAKPAKIVLNHISTTTISGNYLVDNDISYNFTENDFYIGQNYMDNVYVRSKFEAEKLILEEEQTGLKANIFRLGNLMARFSDGTFQENKLNNAYYTRIIALAKFGYLPNNLKHQRLEFTPIDETAQAIIKLLTIPNLENNIFHIFSNKLISIDVLLKVLNNYGYPCKFIDYNKFIDKLYLQKDEKILKYIISDLNTSKKFDYYSNIIIDQGLTNEFLDFVSFKWSTIDEDYLKRFFDKTNLTKDIDL